MPDHRRGCLGGRKEKSGLTSLARVCAVDILLVCVQWLCSSCVCSGYTPRVCAVAILLVCVQVGLASDCDADLGRGGGGGAYFTTTEQMATKHNTKEHNTIDLTSEADGGVGLAAGEAEEAAKAVAAVKAAVGAEEAAEVAKAVEDIEAADEAQAVAMVMAVEDLDLAEEAEMEATRLKYRQLRVEIRQRAMRYGVISLTEALDDTHVPSLPQKEQDAIDM